MHRYGAGFAAINPALVAPASVPVYFMVGRASLPAINIAGRDPAFRGTPLNLPLQPGRYRAVLRMRYRIDAMKH